MDLKIYYNYSKSGAIVLSSTVNGVPAYPLTLILDGLKIIPPKNHVVLSANVPMDILEAVMNRIVKNVKDEVVFSGLRGYLVELREDWRERCIFSRKRY